MNQALLAGITGLIVGGALTGAFMLYHSGFLHRAHAWTVGREWVARNCSEREIQAFEYLVFTPKEANDTDRAVIRRAATRAPDAIGEALRGL